MVYITSDTHYGHANVVTYSNRPFLRDDGQPSVEKMEAELIRRWNDVVAPEDTVFHLGDFAFAGLDKIRSIRERLNGRVVLIRGNHDRSKSAMSRAGFDEVHDRLEMELDGHRIYMAHIPPAAEGHTRRYKPEFTKAPPAYYDWWICGHVHNAWRRRGRVINAGVDQWDYRPVTLAELLTAEDGS